MNIIEVLTFIGLILFGVLLIKFGIDTQKSLKKF